MADGRSRAAQKGHEMDDRKLRILLAVIDDYVHTAVPVGSRTISRKYETALSSATIRNEMSDLEEMGYLEQPHVSAGRIPSMKAYRLYVDSLLSGGMDVPDAQSVREFFFDRVRQMQDVVESAATALSELTRYAAVVLMPKQLDLKVSCLQLVPMNPGSALLVIITDGGVIRNQVIRVSEGLDSDALYAISKVLTSRLAGRTLQEVTEALAIYSRYSGADREVCNAIADMASLMARQTGTDTIAVSGSHNILNYPEYSDVEKARAFLSVLEAKDKLLSFLPEEREGFTVRIGPEMGLSEMADCAAVCASYRIGGGHSGTVGVIGPARMPYGRILGILETVGDALTGLMGDLAR